MNIDVNSRSVNMSDKIDRKNQFERRNGKRKVKLEDKNPMDLTLAEQLELEKRARRRRDGTTEVEKTKSNEFHFSHYKPGITKTLKELKEIKLNK